MANRVALTTGNHSAAATWNTVDAVSLLISTNTSVTALTVAAQASANFVPAAVALQAIAVKVGVRTAGSPTNTITIELRNVTTATVVKSVTANVSDLDVCDATQRNGGWYAFVFDSTHTPNGADTYQVRAFLSATSTAVSLQRDATAANWQRMLITTTTGAAVAGDDRHVMGVLDGATNPATPGTREVTYDETAVVDYGAAVSSVETPALTVNKRGSLVYGIAAATNYTQRVSGMVHVYSGGTFSMGTDANPIPITSTAYLELDCASDNQFFFTRKENGTVNMVGEPRTAGKDVIMCRLNTDEAAAQTVLGVDTDTGWLAGDEIAIASTTTTNTQHERRTLASNATATTLTITAGLTNAHIGSGVGALGVLMNAEVILLTHNVKFRSSGAATVVSSITSQGAGTLNLKWMEFSNCGTTTTHVGSINFSSTTGNQTLNFVTFKDGDLSVLGTTGAACGGWTMEDCVSYNYPGSGAGSAAWLVSATSATDWVLRRITSIACSTGQPCAFQFSDLGGTMEDLSATSTSGGGIHLADTDARNWVIDGLNARSNSGAGIFFETDASGGTIRNFNTSRNVATLAGGIAGSSINSVNMTWEDGVSSANNGNSGVLIRPSGRTARWLFRRVVMAGDPSFSQGGGIRWDPNGGIAIHADWRCEQCTFGVGTPHTSFDIGFSGLGTVFVTMTLVDCTLASATEVGSSFPASFEDGSFLAFQRKDASDTNHSVLAKRGTLAYDAVISHAGLPTMKMTPNSASVKLVSNAGARNKWLILAQTGQTITFTCPVQLDAAYNGNMPRLIALANPSIDIDDDTVLGTHPGGTGSFIDITGSFGPLSQTGVIEIIIDCDGTAGFINVAAYTAVP